MESLEIERLDTIKELFKTGKKFNIIECGCGAIITHSLLSVPGASAFVIYGIQLYSKESQYNYLGCEPKRSVSKENVEALLNKNVDNAIVLSYQIRDKKIDSLTHGWIGIKIDGVNYFYHQSINFNQIEIEDTEIFNEIHERIRYFTSILDCVIKILKYHLIDNNAIPTDCWIDNCENELLFKILGSSTEIDQFVVFENGEKKRMEDFIRGTKGIILMRGSFNPPHKGHIALLGAAMEKYPDYKPAFLVSLNRKDKSLLTEKECMEKLELLKGFGYPVIFSSKQYFFDTMEFINYRWTQEIIFPVGLDTINRFIEDCEKNRVESEWEIAKYNFKFLVFDRKNQALNPTSKIYSKAIEICNEYTDDGISSTKIRNGEW